MGKIEWVFGVDWLSRPTDNALQINLDKWLALTSEQQRSILGHEKAHYAAQHDNGRVVAVFNLHSDAVDFVMDPRNDDCFISYVIIRKDINNG